MEHRVQSHYACPDLIEDLRAGLEKAGKDITNLTPRDLAAVDQLHTGGGPATISLANRAGITRDMDILDAGCGLGGSSRLLTQNFNCRVTGIDLAPDFIETATVLTQWCGMDIFFEQGSILELPHENDSFDMILCQHILMNIENKAGALSEFFRVLRPGGKLILHEIVDGPGPDPIMPVPWAADPDISFLLTWKDLRAELKHLKFDLEYFSDETENSARWWKKINKFTAKSPPRPLNPSLVFGPNAAHFGPNMENNFSSQAVCCIETILSKPA